MSEVVAEYDYYTLEQAEKIIRKRKRDEIKLNLVLGLGMIGIPVAMFLYWLAFGY